MLFITVYNLKTSCLPDVERDAFLEAARFSLLAYADKPELDNLVSNVPAKWSDALGKTHPTEIIWPSFENYKDDYQVFQNIDTDADVFVAANANQARVLKLIF